MKVKDLEEVMREGYNPSKLKEEMENMIKEFGEEQRESIMERLKNIALTSEYEGDTMNLYVNDLSQMGWSNTDIVEELFPEKD